MSETYKARIKTRRETSTNWEILNPILLNGEIVVVDTEDGVKFKIGDGVSYFSQLPFLDKETSESISQKAPLNSPEFTGIPTAPTAASGTNTNQIATTQFVQESLNDVQDVVKYIPQELTEEQKAQARINIGAVSNTDQIQANWTQKDSSALDYIKNKPDVATKQDVETSIANLVNTAPEALDTLNELAAALGNDPNFATSVATQIGNKVDKVKGKQLSTNDYTTKEKEKLESIAAGAEVNVQSDWNQTDKTADDYIKNKPNFVEQLVQSDWEQTDNTQPDFIKNKPAAYKLPIASTKVLGGIKIGAGLSITGNGVVSVGSAGVAEAVEWENVLDKPEVFPPDTTKLAAVATSGDYGDLINTPSDLVTSVNGQIGDVEITAESIGAGKGIYYGSEAPQSDVYDVWINTEAQPDPLVRYDAQTLTEEEKAQARKNIGASNFSGKYADLTDIPELEITVDSAVSLTSTNPVQNKVITQALYNDVEDIYIEIKEETERLDGRIDTVTESLNEGLANIATTYAPIDSPVFTGTPTTPTPTNNNSLEIANAAFVTDSITNALANVETDAVSYNEQALSEDQQFQARTNIGAYAASNVIASTTDLTAGTSELAEGAIYLVYE